MSESLSRDQALVLFDRGYRSQMRGELSDALRLYQRSIAMHPTAEAHTFLGWAYSMLGRHEQAIEECHQAIALDPDYGNPYNDIGAYLLEQGMPDEAIPWLERALEAPNYQTPHFAHLNLGRAYQATRRARSALQAFDRALAIDPFYRTAHAAKHSLLARLN